jgi:ferredoxin-NADP reductase
MLARHTQARALYWIGKQLFNRDNPAAFFDPLLAPVNPMWIQAYTPARIEQIIEETSDTKTFVLKPSARWGGFKAGQHINICTEINGTRNNRTFSLSSSPLLWQEQGLITLTIKRLSGGLVTNWLHDHLKPGAILGIGDAFGDFLLPERAQPVLFIAGGSGITPILSQLEMMGRDNFRAPVTLLYYVRTSLDVIARDKLEALAANYPALSLRIIVSNEGKNPRHLSDQDLESVPGLKARQIYLCGPRGLMDRARTFLHERGIAETDIHSTFFSASKVDLSKEGLGGVVQFVKSSVEVSSEGDANLLDIAEAAGLSPRHGCRMGICHQCSCKKTSGTVVNRLTGQASGLGEENIQLCVSVPNGPVSINA